MSDIDIQTENNNNNQNDPLAIAPPNEMANHLDNFLQNNVFWGKQRTIQNAKTDPNIKHYSKQALNRYLDEKPYIQRHKHKRRESTYELKTVVSSIGYVQIDIADLRSLGNVANPYLLVLIDKFSRMLFLYEMPNRHNDTIIAKLNEFIIEWNGITKYTNKKRITKELLEEPPIKNNKNDNDELTRIKSLTGDREFWSNLIKDWANQHNIDIYSSKPNDKGATSLVERVIQTVRAMIGRWITATGQTDWNSVIAEIERAYNHSKHKSVGVSPVWAFHHIDKFPHLSTRQRKKFDKWQEDKTEPAPDVVSGVKVGDMVRIKQTYSHLHKKSHLPNWSHRIYTVHRRVGNRFSVVPADNPEEGEKMRKRKNIEGTDTDVNINRNEVELFADSDLLVIKRVIDEPENDVWENVRQNNAQRRLERRMAPLIENENIDFDMFDAPQQPRVPNPENVYKKTLPPEDRGDDDIGTYYSSSDDNQTIPKRKKQKKQKKQKKDNEIYLKTINKYRNLEKQNQKKYVAFRNTLNPETKDKIQKLFKKISKRILNTKNTTKIYAEGIVILKKQMINKYKFTKEQTRAIIGIFVVKMDKALKKRKLHMIPISEANPTLRDALSNTNITTIPRMLRNARPIPSSVPGISQAELNNIVSGALAPSSVPGISQAELDSITSDALAEAMNFQPP